MMKAYQQVVDHLSSLTDLTDRQIELLQLYQELLSAALDAAMVDYLAEYQLMLQDINNAIAVPSQITTPQQFTDWIKQL